MKERKRREREEREGEREGERERGRRERGCFFLGGYCLVLWRERGRLFRFLLLSLGGRERGPGGLILLLFLLFKRFFFLNFF